MYFEVPAVCSRVDDPIVEISLEFCLLTVDSVDHDSMVKVHFMEWK